MPRTASAKMPAGHRRLAGSECRTHEGATPVERTSDLEATVILRRCPHWWPQPDDRA